MNTVPTSPPAAPIREMIGAATTAIVAWSLALPAVAQESVMTAAEYAALRQPSVAASETDIGLWSLALLGPAAMIMIVAGLGLTITLRSLRADVRRQRLLGRYWQRGAQTRAAAAMHG